MNEVTEEDLEFRTVEQMKSWLLAGGKIEGRNDGCIYECRENPILFNITIGEISMPIEKLNGFHLTTLRKHNPPKWWERLPCVVWLGDQKTKFGVVDGIIGQHSGEYYAELKGGYTAVVSQLTPLTPEEMKDVFSYQLGETR